MCDGLMALLEMEELEEENTQKEENTQSRRHFAKWTSLSLLLPPDAQRDTFEPSFNEYKLEYIRRSQDCKNKLGHWTLNALFSVWMLALYFGCIFQWLTNPFAKLLVAVFGYQFPKDD